MNARRPNFLFFIPDQLRADAVGAFGNPHVRTPHVDALAARGARFDNAYVQHPVCSPSRASFLTGWYPHTNGHRTLTHLLKPWEPNVLRSLKESGYHVAWPGMRGDTFAPGATELSVDEYGYGVTPITSPTPVTRDTWPGGDTRARLYYRGRPPVDEQRVDADEATIRTAERWLADPPVDRPWVLFVPLIAPTAPSKSKSRGSPCTTGTPCPSQFRPPTTAHVNPPSCRPSASDSASKTPAPTCGARSLPPTTA